MKKGLFTQSIMDWYRQLIRNSKYRWVVLLGTLLYLISPLDISPDMMPILGWVDDGLLATIAITEVAQILLDRKRNLRQTKPSAASETPAEVVEVVATTLS